MYHPKIIEQRVETAEKQLRTGLPGFRVKRLTVGESLAWEERLKLRKGKELDGEEQQHILSELVLAKSDYVYCAERYLRIKTAGMQVTAMPLWPAQQVIVKRFGEMELKIQEGTHEDGIMSQILKSRQQGITTLCALITMHRSLFYGNSMALIASDEEEHSTYVFGMLVRVHDNLPWWMQPVKTYHEKGFELFFGEIDALIRLDWANNKRGSVGEGNLGRGMTPNIFHGSELSSWTELQTDQIEYSLLPGMHPLPSTFGVLESTPKGEGNYFHRTWDQSVAKENRWTPLFVGWYIDPKLHLTPPEGWKPADLTVAHAVRVKRTSPQWAGYEVELTPDQQYWWERNYLAAKKNNKAQKFFSEYAADPETCFASSSDSVFPAEVIAALYQGAKPTLGVFDVLGPGRV